MSLYLGTTPIATTGSNKANISMDNLTSTGKNIANWSSNVSNCITEIPQDINLTLSDGTFTLKAGSKVYVPNGFEQDGTTLKFSAVNISSDLSMTSSANGKLLIFTTTNGGGITNNLLLENCVSGATDTWSGSGVAHMWYDTSTNIMRYYNSSGVASGTRSLPIAIVTVSSGSITSIDQVFNGFGYIGSTVFALPGVKGLIPNGRNSDGTLKNIAFTSDSVKTYTQSYTITSALFTLSQSGVGIIENRIAKYNEDTNNNVELYNNTPYYAVTIASASTTSGVVSNWNPQTAFHLLGWNDLLLGTKFRTVVETYSNGTSWYRLYSDGWCEQGGLTETRTSNAWIWVSLLKSYSNTNYNITLSIVSTQTQQETMAVKDVSTNGFNVYGWNMRANYWRACGYTT